MGQAARNRRPDRTLPAQPGSVETDPEGPDRPLQGACSSGPSRQRKGLRPASPLVRERLGSCGRLGLSQGWSAKQPFRLRRALRRTLEDDHYDFVLIDCPPSLGLVTLNGLRISDYYLIPTVPDFLSTYGIPQIIKRIGDFSDAVGHTIEPLGIVATKYRAQSPVHNQQLRVLQQDRDARLLKTVIPENSEISGAAEYKQVSTLRQKWGYRGQFDVYRALAKEVLECVQVAVGS